jgi:hypothetical protein
LITTDAAGPASKASRAAAMLNINAVPLTLLSSTSSLIKIHTAIAVMCCHRIQVYYRVGQAGLGADLEND